MKKKIISRMKLYKKQHDLSYQEMAIVFGFNSSTTIHRYLKYQIIPANRYEMLVEKLNMLGV